MRRALHAARDVEVTILTLLGAVLVGFGVPALWLWLAALIAGTERDLTSSLAVFIATGIVVTYWVILAAAGIVRARLVDGRRDSPPVRRMSWNRSMRDEPFRPGRGESDPVERLFIVATLLVGIATLLWFALFAGSPLPEGSGGPYGAGGA